MKEQCKKIRNMILEGSESAEVIKHTEVCDECRMLAESMVFFKEHSVLRETEGRKVPAHLDASVKFAARQRLKQKRSGVIRIFFEVGSFAALAVFAMVVLFQQQEQESEPTPVAQTAAAEVKTVDMLSSSLEKDLDRMHSALADIADGLDDCGMIEDVSLTDISNISQMELDYAIYQANF